MLYYDFWRPIEVRSEGMGSKDDKQQDGTGLDLEANQKSSNAEKKSNDADETPVFKDALVLEINHYDQKTGKLL